MHKEAMKGRVESIKAKVIDITGNTRDDNFSEDGSEVPMHADKDRVGFAATRRNVKKGNKNDRY
ncbi:hypothetical protein [Methylomonas koyamae]|uniref:hypothetical protein n=1 Tax=Methylomonas koyamae TaxID=702114 RepID=UPI00112AA9D3|nr:hypothetical protein [Methylomonas koyamae]TPQ26221.1 hypothetical protein C2U68_12335 [Methylomonas koyamae]